MTNTFRDALQKLHTSIQLYTGQNPAAADVHPAELTRRLMDAMAASADALAKPEPVAPQLVYRYSPVTVAECGGPCEQGPQYCDCGEIKGEPAPEPVAPPMPVPGDAEGLAEVFWGRYDQPEPVLPPSYIDAEHTGQDQELLEVFYKACLLEGGTADEIHLRGLKAVLARYSRPAIQPVPVSERLPTMEADELDDQGTCWNYHPINLHYCLCVTDPSVHTHWLPHRALPTPEANP